jgi:2',3'-cyclic-nucleotide 2'-phosphodiesterase (5'-nucleotidase family)
MISLHPSLLPGALHVIQGRPNPNGAKDATVYLLCGDATARPVTQIMPAQGVQLPPSQLPLTRPVRLKLLHWNDLHSRLTGRNFSRMVAWMRAARTDHADDPNVAVLAVSAGDDSGGSIFDELLGYGPESFQLHAPYRLYSSAGVDVAVPGNHDLDRGAALLAHAIRQEAGFPILAANLTGSPALAECCCPAAIFVVKRVRVGLIGLITPAQIHPEPNSLWRITDPVKVAQNLVPAIRPLCDVLIILSHLGYRLGQHGAAVEVAGDVELAQSLPTGSVHLIVGGHTHTTLNESGLSIENIVNGIPVVQAGKSGQFMGEVDITVGEAAVVTHARLRATADLPVDEAFEREQVQPVLARVQPYRERIIGRVAQDEDLSTDAVRNSFASGESALANFIADALVAQMRGRGYPVDFAVVDASSISCGLPLGGDAVVPNALSFGDWFELMPYADTVCLCRLSGRQLVELLDDNARRCDRPAEPHTERGFLHLSREVRGCIALGSTRGLARACDIRLQGQPIEHCLDRTFTVAYSSFLRGLAAAWETHARERLGLPLFDLRQLPHEYIPLTVRDLLVDYISDQGGVLPEGGARRDGRLCINAAKVGRAQ